MGQFRDRQLWLLDHLQRLLLWIEAGRPTEHESFSDMARGVVKNPMRFTVPKEPRRPEGPPAGWPPLQVLIDTYLPPDTRFACEPLEWLETESVRKAVQELHELVERPCHVLRRDGDDWVFELPGEREFRVRDQPGIRYLAVLLSKPGRRIDLSDIEAANPRPNLRGRHSAQDENARPTFDDLGVGGGRIGRSAGDPEALGRYRRMLQELVVMLETADLEESKRKELEDARSLLEAEIELVKHGTSDVSRDRKRVYIALKRLYEKIPEEVAHDDVDDHVSADGVILSLAEHLCRSVKIRNVGCIYNPPVPVLWFVSTG